MGIGLLSEVSNVIELGGLMYMTGWGMEQGVYQEWKFLITSDWYCPGEGAVRSRQSP